MLKIGLKELTPLSSVAYGDTPFQRKGALAVRHAAFVTQRRRRKAALLMIPNRPLRGLGFLRDALIQPQNLISYAFWPNTAS